MISFVFDKTNRCSAQLLLQGALSEKYNVKLHSDTTSDTLELVVYRGDENTPTTTILQGDYIMIDQKSIRIFRGGLRIAQLEKGDW